MIRNIRRRQRGVSIVEALVALVVLSVGMLGIANMYLESLRSNRTARARTVAIQLVNDMADRIRSNRGGLADYNNTQGNAPAAGKDCSKNECTPKEVAQYDLSQWYVAVTNVGAPATDVRSGLPKGADGSVPQIEVKYIPGTNPTDPGRYTVKALWKEPGSDSFLSASVEVMQIGG